MSFPRTTTPVTTRQDPSFFLDDRQRRAPRPPERETPFGPSQPPHQSVRGVLRELLAPAVEEARTAPARTEPIRDVVRVEARLRALAALEARISVHLAGGARADGTLVSTVSDGPFPLRLDLGSVFPIAPFDVEVVGYNSVHRFSVERSLRVGNHVAVPLPTELLRIERRLSRRAEAPAGLTVEFTHPVLPELQVRRAVRDVSRGGLAFDTRVDHDILVPGLRLLDVVVTTPAGAQLQFDAEVRVLHEPRGGRGATAGVELTPRSDGDAGRWEQLVGDALNPHTRLGATWSEDTWDLYRDSGYFNLSAKSAPHFARLKAPFASATRRLDAAPQLGCQVTWPSERGIEASLSLLKLYTHTWFGYQMAKRPGAPPDGSATNREVLREIHLRGYEHAQSDPDLRWAMGLVQDAAKWSKLVHYDLPARYVDSGMAALVGFHALEFDIPERAAPATPGLVVGPATPGERDAALASLARHRPWAWRDALDLVPERFDLAALSGGWRTAGFNRRRELLSARAGGKLVAVAVLESADPGLHLFNLLDCVRVHALAPEGTRAFAALLDAAGAWFRAQGRTSFTCMLEEGTPADVARLSPRDLGRGTTTLLSVELVPALLEHVWEVTAPRIGSP